MKQLELFDTSKLPQGREYKPVPGPLCPLCAQKMGHKHLLINWFNYRTWLHENKSQVYEIQLQRLKHTPPHAVVLHPDLEWAVRAEAGYRRMEFSDLINEIVDSYMEGNIRSIKRRKKRRKQTTLELATPQTDYNQDKSKKSDTRE